jgi:hypothetical protein
MPSLYSFIRLTMLTGALCSVSHSELKDCAALASVSIAEARIQAELVSTSTFTPPSGRTISDLPNFCRVAMTLTPSSDSRIQMELWLPIDNWNGRLQGIGNGGYAGSISYDSLAAALRLHYASVATDAGHQGAAEDATWALNHPEKIVDFAYRAIHLMTADARQTVQAFYGKPVSHAYFNSCSNGGREALMEAQRFPDDYDGIIAGAPANYWTHLVTNAAANAAAFLRTGSSAILTSKLPAIQAAAQQACDLDDHVKDNVIEDPARCHFDTSVLLCNGAESDACLTADQLVTLNQLYAGGHLSNGKAFFPGYAPGGQATKGGWDEWITGAAPGRGSIFAYGSQFFKNLVYDNPDWDFHSFEADRDLKAADDKLAKTLNATDTNLRKFVAHGGKLILYHGWDDAAIAPANTINYFGSVQKKMGRSSTRAAVRLFMVPGMQHCFDGNGAYSFGQFGAGGGDADHDIDAALVRWVEEAVPPSQIIAAKPETAMTHLVCAYPATAHYDGSGAITAASSYHCMR